MMSVENQNPKTAVEDAPEGTETEERQEDHDTIENRVIGAIVRHVAMGVNGVADVSQDSIPRKITERLTRGQSRGVDILSSNEKVAIDVGLTVNFGTPIPEIFKQVRSGVRAAIEETCGMQVVQLNVTANEIRFEGDPEKSRLVQ